MFFNLNNNIEYVNNYNDTFNIFKYSSYLLAKYDKLYEDYKDLENKKNKELFELRYKYNKLKDLYKKSKHSNEYYSDTYYNSNDISLNDKLYNIEINNTSNIDIDVNNIIKNTKYDYDLIEDNLKNEIKDIDTREYDIDYIKL